MSALHIRQIRNTLEQTVLPLIDLSDLAEGSEKARSDAGMSRSLAAFVLGYAAEVSNSDACAAVTDGFGDNGLDAILYQPTTRTLYLAQAKWQATGKGSLALGDATKFIKGFRDLINTRWSRFNAKIRALQPALDVALNDSQTRIVLMVAYSGQAPLSKDAMDAFNDVLTEVNNPSEIVTLQVFRQTDLYSVVTHGVAGSPINVDVALYEWGQVQEPYKAIYEQISASDLGQWFTEHRLRLFSPNIRMFLGNTDVNQVIVTSIESSPSHFWYFNNGITALCRAFSKRPIGGDGRVMGLFHCEDLRIVNGAQTVGAVAQAYGREPSVAGQAKVPIRIISLEHCPPDFASEVTRFNNTQNRIDRRDFVALDSTQERLRAELQLEGVTYAYKSGDTLPPGTPLGFDLTEATIALACSQAAVDLSVQAKREIGRLWEDIERPPYRTLFNDSLLGPALWRRVQVLRAIEGGLALKLQESDSRGKQIGVHGNRFIAHVTFTMVTPEVLDVESDFDDAARQEVASLSGPAFEATYDAVEEGYPEAYLASLFKNASKCQDLAARWVTALSSY